ncbi:hypothetical protein [Hyphomicrobium sp.]|uniref:hypothetical protein n=1 Tax=Hyphomicrobium sp. TaxID=82 RepID=UPI0025B90CEC|nr:hypothetical protein [Hyphomicrobium sp.]MCC7252362.1 hypothetical protein [Hyphomicrobium sp.]
MELDRNVFRHNIITENLHFNHLLYYCSFMTTREAFNKAVDKAIDTLGIISATAYGAVQTAVLTGKAVEQVIGYGTPFPPSAGLALLFSGVVGGVLGYAGMKAYLHWRDAAEDPQTAQAASRSHKGPNSPSA